MSTPDLQIIEDRCTGCGLCAKACPFGAITVEARTAAIDYDKCTLCGACASVCPTPGAIDYTRPQPRRRKPEGDVAVFCEVVEGELARISRELLGTARSLADQLGVSVTAVLAGRDLETAARQAIKFGADRSFMLEHPGLDSYRDEPYATVIAELLRKHKPAILLGGATAVGRALLPRLAVLLHTGLTADCTELAIDPETSLLLQTRPAFGGNILATIACENHRPQMATVRPGVLPQPEFNPERTGSVERVAVDSAALESGIDWLSSRTADRSGEDIREAEIIVAAGKGVGGPEGVRQAAELADLLGGALGASRAVVDAGWAGYSHQVGQTGTTVQPKLYIACGISGAIQHVAGMQSSDRIIAINRDTDAPIFDHADLVVVADVREILPAWAARLRKGASTANRG